MQLEIQEGAHLYSAEGEDLGTVRQFVVVPSTGELTHILVEKGVFFTDDHVVPIGVIDHAEGDEVVLGDDVDPTALPKFVREDYTPLDEQTRSRLDVPPGYMWRYPTTYTGPFPIYPTYPMPPGALPPPQIDDTRTRDALADSEVIGARTPVLSMDGDKVGTVSEMYADEDGRLSHLVVDLGFLSDKKVLPAQWIDSVEADAVKLAVSNHAVESLETIT